NKSEFIIYSNIIYYLLIKNKRVIRSIFILKVYSIINSVNLAHAILITLRRIINKLNFL
ncbi:aurora kinase 2 splicing, partial [Colletotrichum cuscutae]